MSSGETLVVNFAALHQASADIQQALGALDTQLSQLERDAAPLVSTWDGDARQAYDVRQAAWRRAAGDLAAMAPTDIDALIAVNLTAPLRLAQAALPGMRSRGRGHLVFVSSIAAVGVGGEAVYAATKAGLRTFAASVRHEVAGEGIGVTTLLPGAVRTPFFEHRGLPYDRNFPRPLTAAKVATALLQAIERGEPEVFAPRWLSVAARVQGAVPELFHQLAQHFG